jgi:hypothetical protein
LVRPRARSHIVTRTTVTSTRRARWVALLVTAIVITAPGLFLLMISLDQADKLASVIGALGTLAGLGLSLSAQNVPPSSGTVHSLDQPHPHSWAAHLTAGQTWVVAVVCAAALAGAVLWMTDYGQSEKPRSSTPSPIVSHTMDCQHTRGKCQTKVDVNPTTGLRFECNGRGNGSCSNETIIRPLPER